jgi:hypothetical protein
VLDKELEKRDHRFVRYAMTPIFMCLARGPASGRLGKQFLANRLTLKVNKTKSTVASYGMPYLDWCAFGPSNCGLPSAGIRRQKRSRSRRPSLVHVPDDGDNRDGS